MRKSLFNLAKNVVPVLHEELESKVEKLKYKKQRIAVRLKWTQQLYAAYHCLLLFLFTVVLFVYKN